MSADNSGENLETRPIQSLEGITRLVTMEASFWDSLEFLLEERGQEMDDILSAAFDMAADKTDANSIYRDYLKLSILGYYHAYLAATYNLANDNFLEASAGRKSSFRFLDHDTPHRMPGVIYLFRFIARATTHQAVLNCLS